MKQFPMSFLLPALLAASTLARQSPAQSGSASAGLLGPQVVAWSMLNEPQPLAQEPHPLPPPDNKAGQQSDPKNQPPQESQQPDAGRVTADSVTGTILKVRNKFVLRTAAEVNYQLDDQKKAKPFEGKRVKVLGTLDPATNLIYVSSIQPTS
jgi:Protein of unknown function (DUF5818)